MKDYTRSMVKYKKDYNNVTTTLVVIPTTTTMMMMMMMMLMIRGGGAKQYRFQIKSAISPSHNNDTS